MLINQYEERLTGGHPNSLGNTIEVVNDILKNENRLKDLIDCWKSSDEVVRLRVQNALKRVAKEHPDWAAVYIPDYLSWISEIDQPSTKWCLSTLFMWLDAYLSDQQRAKAITIMKSNLNYDDWIVQNTTSESLAYFAKSDEGLRKWLIPELKKLANSRHKSVARRAQKLIIAM
jgi:hypothetical protein